MRTHLFISLYVVFLLVSILVAPAYSTDIGEIKRNGENYVLMTENPNAESRGIGWIPEGDFVQILAGPFAGTIDRIPAQWHQVEYRQQTGFVLSHLLNFYRLSSTTEEKDIAKVKVNGNGYVLLRASSSIDSSTIGCIPEGKIVKVQSDPIKGYVGDKSGYWYKVENQGAIGYIWEELLEFYSFFPQPQRKHSDQEENKLIDDKTLAKMVIEMIRNGQEIVFNYKNGKISLNTTQPPAIYQPPYPPDGGL